MSDLTHEVKKMEEALTKHYGEPVRPVSQYCNAFYTWHKAIGQKIDDNDFLGGEWVSEHEREEWQKIYDAFSTLYIPIAKSNLLHRLIYVGEPLRTEKCPIHKGKWSGCAFGDGGCPYCMSGTNITGWVK